MPKELVNIWNSVKKTQNTMPRDRAEELNAFSPFFAMLTVMGNAADVYDKNGNRLDLREWQDRIAEQQQKKRSGEDVSNDVFYLHSHADESEMYEATVEYGEFNPFVTMGENPISAQDRDIILEQPQKAKGNEPEAEEPEEEEPEIEPAPEAVSKKFLEAFAAYEQGKAVMYPEDRDINWEAAADTYFGFLSELTDEAIISDKLGRPLDKEAWQNQIIAKQQNSLDGKAVQSDTFYLQSNKNDTVRFAMTVAYDGKTPTMTMENQPLSEKEWHDRLTAASVEALEAQKEAAKQARKAVAVDKFFAAWKKVEDFKKSPGMEKRGMDVMSVNKLSRALQDVQNEVFVFDEDGNRQTADAWTSRINSNQSKCENGEKVPKDTFYLQCKHDANKWFKLSVGYGKTQPTLNLNKTPLPPMERAAWTAKWTKEKEIKEAFEKAGVDRADLRARRERIENAPKRLLDAFKGVQKMKNAPYFKRATMDHASLELHKNLENVLDIATICDAAGNKLDADSWFDRIAKNELTRQEGKTVPKDTFYLTCKDDNSKMFKVTVEYGKNKPKFKIDKTPIYEDERWRLRGEWQKNAAQAEMIASQEDSPEKQNQKEKTAVARNNTAKGAVTGKAAEPVAKNATETVISPSLAEREKAASRDANGYTQPSWKKYDINSQKTAPRAAMELGAVEPLMGTDKENPNEVKQKNFEKELTEKEKDRVENKLSVYDRDMTRANWKMNKVLHKEIGEKFGEENVNERKMAEGFRKEALAVASENENVRHLLTTMEDSSVQKLYAKYREDVKKNVEPTLKGDLINTFELGEESLKNFGLNKTNELNKNDLYFPVPLDEEDLISNEENQVIEERLLNPMG